MSKYIIAIDQSTSASKVFLVDEAGEIVKRYAEKHHQGYPRPGYVEHNAWEIWTNVEKGIREVSEGVANEDLVALAISNQRETTVLWDRETGKPLCPAVVWQDVRGQYICDRLEKYGEEVRQRTGLQLSPYYPAAKAACVLEENEDVRQAAKAGKLCIGTIDSYLVFMLTGGKEFRTDVSNAGRMQLMKLSELKWDEDICGWFGIDPAWLPEITPSDGQFGRCHWNNVPITGVMGDSHAALFGQGCTSRGMAKATYGTGSSVMMNIGPEALISSNGLSACVAFGFQGEVSYALEGNVTCSGDTLCWLRDEAKMVDDVLAVEGIASTVPDAGGAYLVPAFSGLGAPHFDSSARAMMCGISRGTTHAHLVRAALESIAYQDRDIIEAMTRDVGAPLVELRVDGGPTKNALLMQFQADVLDCPVQLAAASELSALGAGYMAGIACGLYESLDTIPARKKQGQAYKPGMEAEKRQSLLDGWDKAVARCLK